VHQRQPRFERGVAQIGEELSQLLGREHALVDDGARREGREVEPVDRALGPLAHHEGLPLERHQVDGRGARRCEEHLLDPGYGPQRRLPQPGGLRRHDTPAEHPEALLARQLLDRGPCLEGVVPVDGQENQSGRIAPGFGELEARRGRRDRQEAVRHLNEDPCAVARLHLGAGRAAMRQSLEHGEAALDDVVVRLSVQVCDHSDATGVVLVCRVVEANGHRRPSEKVWGERGCPGRRWPEGRRARIHDRPPRLGRMARRVLVVGGGVIGLACAWRLSRDGHGVTVVAPEPGRAGASWVAAGMLAPVTEAQFGESALTALLLEGARHWPSFAARLERESGREIGYVTTGTVTVALDASDRAALDDLLTYHHAVGLESRRCSASECRRLVPALSPAIRGGVEVPGDHQVDNRALLGALAEACTRSGVGFDRTSVAALEAGPELVLADGRRLGADHVVLAAGTGLPGIAGLDATGIPAVRPVKGHILRLGGPGDGAPLLPRTVRGLVRGHSVYLVPRRDGSVVVGATVEERGDDTTVQAGAVHELLCDARAIVPAVDELELLEAAAGVRPASEDNMPRIGWTAADGVLVATGHYRSGILLAPFTAAAVSDLLARDRDDYDDDGNPPVAAWATA
jgi:glycine oxidase